MGTNKVVSVVLLDVNKSMHNQSDNGESFFERSVKCLKKMVLRKMFSQDNDEMGLILFGANDTNNTLARGSLYQNVSTFSPVKLPTWELYREIEAIKISEREESDWVEGLIVAIDFMKTEIQGRRFKTKQIIVFSNCAGENSVDEESLEPVLNVMTGENIQFVVIGNDIEEECSQDIKIPKSLQLMLNAVTKLESAVHFSFTEIENDLQYFEKKRKMPRLLKVNLTIGSNIQLPVRWMKVTHEETRFKWDYQSSSLPCSYTREVSKSNFKNEGCDVTSVEYVTDTLKKTNFGASIIDLSYADLEAMKRNSGPASFYYLGSIKSSKVSRSMFVGNDVYIVVADKDARSVSMFSAFVDALIKAGKYGIARRIPIKNGKISIGALLPVSDDLGKALYFFKLPYAEWVKKIPEKQLVEATKEEGLKAMSDLIDAAMLPEDLLEEGKGLLVRDPTFQSACHALTLRATGELPEYSLPALPDHVQRIIRPVEMSEEANKALSRLAEIFPYTPPEPKPSSKKGGKPKGPSDVNLPPQPVRSNKVEAKIEIDDILVLAEENYDNVFSEELF